MYLATFHLQKLLILNERILIIYEVQCISMIWQCNYCMFYVNSLMSPFHVNHKKKHMSHLFGTLFLPDYRCTSFVFFTKGVHFYSNFLMKYHI
jgi:hypothetical protein